MNHANWCGKNIGSHATCYDSVYLVPGGELSYGETKNKRVKREREREIKVRGEGVIERNSSSLRRPYPQACEN